MNVSEFFTSLCANPSCQHWLHAHLQKLTRVKQISSCPKDYDAELDASPTFLTSPQAHGDVESKTWFLRSKTFLDASKTMINVCIENCLFTDRNVRLDGNSFQRRMLWNTLKWSSSPQVFSSLRIRCHSFAGRLLLMKTWLEPVDFFGSNRR